MSKKNNSKRILVCSIALSMCLPILAGCGKDGKQPVENVVPTEAVAAVTEAPTSAPTSTPTTAPTNTPTPKAEYIDFAANLKLNRNSESVKTEATVAAYVDGDTVHFNVPTTVLENGLLKARFLAVNTPESTGKIEEYGKAASKFTREKLSNATSIILESDNSKWNADSTGGRYLVWVWYRTSETEDYRNLNLELLQNGLALASNTNGNRYGETAMSALDNAKACKLMLYSGEKDPDFYYGSAIELTLRELKANIQDYVGKTVAFEGVVVGEASNTVYVEEYDSETGLYNGISVYYGFNLSGTGLSILTVGNRVRIVGSCQYYEAGDSYQISDVNYKMMKPKDPGNIQLLEEGHSASYAPLDLSRYPSGEVTFSTENTETGEITTQTMSYGDFILGSTVSCDNLQVKKIYTTTDDSSSSKGAMTIYCTAEDGSEVVIRTVVLQDEKHNVITADMYEGHNISVKGIMECYKGSYQIKVLSRKYITINQ